MHLVLTASCLVILQGIVHSLGAAISSEAACIAA